MSERDGGADQVRTLIVVRHGKAGDPPGGSDRERPLTARGERDARAAGTLIRPLRPNLVLCSPAERTRRTAELLDLDVPVQVERDIYEAYPEDLVDVLRRTEPEVDTLVLVGHNPGVHQLVLALTGAAGERFPPGAFAVLELAGPWAHAAEGMGRLVMLHLPGAS